MSKNISGAEFQKSPIVSVIIPCRNEESFIADCLDSVLGNNYPLHVLDVIVVDGMSEDETLSIVTEYVRKYPVIRLLENPATTIPSALNLGIRNARGSIIARLDAHSTWEQDYLSRCVTHLLSSTAARIGGRIITVPQNDTYIGKAIALVLSSPFGVGNSRFRTMESGVRVRPLETDTVPFWCCRKEVFEHIGLFNERLERSEDIEFSLRMRRQGFKTLMIPDLVGIYYARSSYVSFWKHNVLNGIWAILPFAYTKEVPVSFRHLIPLGFVSCIIALGFLALIHQLFWVPLLLVLASYLLMCFVISFVTAVRMKDFRLVFTMPAAFWMLHVGYGLGSLIGLGKIIWMSFKRHNRNI